MQASLKVRFLRRNDKMPRIENFKALKKQLLGYVPSTISLGNCGLSKSFMACIKPHIHEAISSLAALP